MKKAKPKFTVDDADLCRRLARKWNTDPIDKELLYHLADRLEQISPKSDVEYDERQERY